MGVVGLESLASAVSGLVRQATSASPNTGGMGACLTSSWGYVPQRSQCSLLDGVTQFCYNRANLTNSSLAVGDLAAYDVEMRRD